MIEGLCRSSTCVGTAAAQEMEVRRAVMRGRVYIVREVLIQEVLFWGLAEESYGRATW